MFLFILLKQSISARNLIEKNLRKFIDEGLLENLQLNPSKGLTSLRSLKIRSRDQVTNRIPSKK